MWVDRVDLNVARSEGQGAWCAESTQGRNGQHL